MEAYEAYFEKDRQRMFAKHSARKALGGTQLKKNFI